MAEVIGYGTKFQTGNTADYSTATTWTDVAAVVDITPPEPSADAIKTSHMQTTSQIHTYIAGWSESGEVELTIQYDKTQAATVIGYYRTLKAFRIVFNDGTYPACSGVKFNGFVSSYGFPVDIEGLVEMTIKVKVSGPILHDTDVTS